VEHQVVQPEVAVHDGDAAFVARAGRHVGGQPSISWSISGMGWVMEATYCLLQRPIWRSK
jgi:hypothetical protein